MKNPPVPACLARTCQALHRPVLICALLAMLSASKVSARVTLPVEVMSANSTERTVTVATPAGSSAKRLSMQVHKLSYQTKVSARVNGGAWVALRNDNNAVSVAEPRQTLRRDRRVFLRPKTHCLTPLIAGVNGNNNLTFRFNGAANRSSGFRGLSYLCSA